MTENPGRRVLSAEEIDALLLDLQSLPKEDQQFDYEVRHNRILADAEALAQFRARFSELSAGDQNRIERLEKVHEQEIAIQKRVGRELGLKDLPDGQFISMQIDKAPPDQFGKALPSVRVSSMLGWSGPTSLWGAAITSFWLIYIAYEARGIWAALLALLVLSVCYGVGPALMFAVSASFLCFYFQAVGLWLPLLSYLIAMLSLLVAIQSLRARRAVDPFDS